MSEILLTIVLAPLAASVIAGLFGRQVGRAGAHYLVGALSDVPALLPDIEARLAGLEKP